MRFAVRALLAAGVTEDRVFLSMERNMQCAAALCGHCQLGPFLLCRDGPVLGYRAAGPLDRSGSCELTRTTRPAPTKPTLAVWKFASCDGCQLTLLNCEDELLAITDAIQVANFTEASREVVAGPYDLSLVEGSITTPHDAERIREVRQASKFLVTIGACATSGGIQALRNFAADLAPMVYATPALHRHAAHVHRDRRPRAGRLRAARLPDRPPPAARGDLGVPARAASRRSAGTASASSASAPGTPA